MSKKGYLESGNFQEISVEDLVKMNPLSLEKNNFVVDGILIDTRDILPEDPLFDNLSFKNAYHYDNLQHAKLKGDGAEMDVFVIESSLTSQEMEENRTHFLTYNKDINQYILKVGPLVK